MDHRKDLTFKEFILVIKKEGKPTEYRNYEAYNRDYARGYADMLQISENCTVTVKTKKKSARPLIDILNDVKKSDNIVHIISLWNEIAYNKHNYTLAQLEYANKYLSEKALESDGNAFEKGRFYWELKAQRENAKKIK